MLLGRFFKFYGAYLRVCINENENVFLFVFYELIYTSLDISDLYK